jgi:hypothetical protein
MAITMTFGFPVLAKIAEVDGVGHRSENSIVRRRAAVVRSLLLHAVERGVEVAGG